MGGSVDKWSFIGKAELCFTKDIELIVNKALKKLNILCKLCGINWASRSQTLRSTCNTVIWHVLDEGALIWTLSSTTVKSRLDTMQYRMFIILLSAVSKINNQNAEQQCRPTSLERRHKFATVKFTNNIRSTNEYCISNRIFSAWKHTTRHHQSSFRTLSLIFFKNSFFKKKPHLLQLNLT